MTSGLIKTAAVLAVFASTAALISWPDRSQAHGGRHNPVRHQPVMMNGVPAPYRDMANPFAGDAAALAEGGRLYAANCALCHGPAGLGDGEGAAGLDPPPPALRRPDMAAMPQPGQQMMGGMGRGMGMGPGMQRMLAITTSDGFYMWTISEGGEVFGTAMPVFKDTLTEEQRWKVISYLQANFPEME